MSDSKTATSTTSELDFLIRARYPIIWIVSYEEERVLNALKKAVRANKKLFVWSISKGWQSGNPADATYLPKQDGPSDPYKAISFISQTEQDGVFVLKDFHPFMNADPTVVRMLRDLREELRTTRKTCVILSPVFKLPPELEKDINVVDFDLPTVEQLGVIRDGVLKSVEADPGIDTKLTPEQKDKIAEAALGLTAFEAENVFAKSLVKNKKFDLDTILAEKEQIIRKTGLLEFYHAVEDVSGVGGLENLKAWLVKRGSAFSQEAREYGLPLPKGILMIGCPGCGKSLTAKAISNLWQLPLLRFDMGRVFGSLVGESEDKMRRAIKTAEAAAPAVLWIDELEKGLAGAGGSGSLDSGVTARVFGTFITWLQEKTSPVFVVATANNVSALPPELLRKGRFDEIFFVDLPSARERRDIVNIHIAKRSTKTHVRDPKKFDIGALVEMADGYSGAEIEQAVVSALYDSFDKKRALSTEDVAKALHETVPLSQTMREQIAAMREWAKVRARPASIEPTKAAASGNGARALELN